MLLKNADEQAPRFHHANFMTMVLIYTEAMNNSAARKKFGVKRSNIHRWQQMKDKLRNVNSSRKAFREPVEGSFHELEQCVFEYVCEKHKDSFPITRDVIRMKALELLCQIQYPEILTSSKSVPDGALA
jgi:hypothetical protein